MSESGTPVENQVRLIPDGCDYLLRGTARTGADGDELPVRAIAPGGTPVLVHVPRDAPGLVVIGDSTSPDGEVLVQLTNVFVSAARVRPAS